MSEQKPSTAHDIPVWGVVLLFLGVVFLLQTLNVLPWSLWGTLWRFWPVLIIIVGLGILLRHYNPWLISALLLLLLFGFLGIAIWQYQSSPMPSTVISPARSYSAPLGKLKSAQIEIDFTAGTLAMSSLTSNSPNLVEVTSQGGDGNEFMRAGFSPQDSTGRLALSTEGADRQPWNEVKGEVRLTRDIPLTLEIKSAVGNLDLDFSGLKVTELRIDVDAGNYKITMPSSAGMTTATIKADVANLEIIIPEGAVASIRADTNLATLDADEERFPKKDGFYVSKGFENAQNRIDLKLDCNLGRVLVK